MVSLLGIIIMVWGICLMFGYLDPWGFIPGMHALSWGTWRPSSLQMVSSFSALHDMSYGQTPETELYRVLGDAYY